MPRSAKRLTVYETFDEQSPAATEFRRLYSRLRYRNRTNPFSPLLVTSAQHAEGKTTTAAFLAATIARYHHSRVILADMDLHRPRQHELFDIPKAEGPGVAEVLLGEAAAADATVSTRYENLSVVPAGKRVAAPSTLFETVRVRRFFEELRSMCDVVILDSPPLIPVSDTMLLSVEAAAVLFVLMAGTTPREVAVRAKGLLSDVNARVIGVVVNNAEQVLPYYYDYKYYGYR
jgi:capsular exopolysaccharide synthesis family protein